MTSQSDLLSDPTVFVPVERCTLCGSAGRELKFREGRFEVMTCADCGLVYVTPRLRPDVLPRVYDEGYWTSEGPKDRGYADYRSDAELYLKTFRRRISILERHRPGPGRLLDVGCAAGFFLEVALERGWDAVGLEPSADIAASARERVGADRVHVGVIEEAPFPARSFDAITMWDVLEHVPDPKAFMLRVGELLEDDGVLILETQNVASRFARRMGPRWQHYKHLEHLYHFDPTTITRLLGEVGFEVVENTPKLGGKYVTVGFIRERAERLSRAMRWLLLPLAPFDRCNFYVNLDDEMVIAARKRPAGG
ncbi:MAG: class I SAM-dependent methyltransferase [Planctomycetota bacterium]